MEYTKEDYAKLFEKMRRVTDEIGAIQKTGKHSQGWGFMEADAIATAVRSAMVKHGLAFSAAMVNSEYLPVPDTMNKNTTRAKVWMEFRILDCETGCVWSEPFQNEAYDQSDKTINKAVTAAKKYWLIATFLISTKEDDSDDDDTAYSQQKPSKSGDSKRSDKPAATPPQSPKNGTKSGFTPQGFEDFVRRWKSDIFTPQRIMEILGIQKGSDWKGTPDEADEALYLWRKEFEDNLPI